MEGVGRAIFEVRGVVEAVNGDGRLEVSGAFGAWTTSPKPPRSVIIRPSAPLTLIPQASCKSTQRHSILL